MVVCIGQLIAVPRSCSRFVVAVVVVGVVVECESNEVGLLPAEAAAALAARSLPAESAIAFVLSPLYV